MADRDSPWQRADGAYIEELPDPFAPLPFEGDGADAAPPPPARPRRRWWRIGFTAFFALLLVTILSVVWDFNVFNQIWILTQGGPNGTTTTLGIWSFTRAFSAEAYGQGAAIAVVTRTAAPAAEAHSARAPRAVERICPPRGGWWRPDRPY